MSRLTLAFAAVTLLSLVHIGTGVIVGTVPKWVLWNNSPGCGTDFISSSAECLQAAKKLGFTGRLNANRWDNKPPGCSSGTSGYVYFNVNTEGTTDIASLRSICLYPGSAVIPEAFALTIPACQEEDNIVYYGHDFGYPNNTRVFPNGTVADCANWCGEVGECKFWTFEKTAKKCWLKDDIGSDHRINNDRVSGSKECAAPPPDESGSEVVTEETLELGSGYEEMSEEPMNVGISLGYGNTKVEEILLEAELGHLEKENANLKRKLQMMDMQLLNMQNLEKLNEKIAQENSENMRENENLITKKKMQAIEIEQLHENLQSSQNKGNILQNKLTKTIQNLKNVTENANNLESQLDTELVLKSTYQEDAQIERQMHGITKQELVNSRNLIKVSMNFTKLLDAHISQLENMTDPVDMRSTINQMKTKENLYMAENLAYQNEIHELRNVTSTGRDQNENLINSMTQQGKLEKLKERMINILQSSLMEMARTIPNCTTITTQELKAQLDAVLEEDDPLKQLISECSIFNETSANLQNLYIQHNTQLKDQLVTKLNVINHHIEENREFNDALEETKQLVNIQSQSLKLLTSEMDRLLPNGITRVQRNADGNIESVYLCQCIPEALKASELEISAIQWTCADDKAVNPQHENTFSHTCPGSDCSVEASSFPQCQDVLEKAWSSWEYFDCIEVDVGNETILCGNGNRSRSREVRSPFANSWRIEDVSEQCEQCSLTAASSAVAISPPALKAALKTVMDVADQVRENAVSQCSSSFYTVWNDDWRKIDYYNRGDKSYHCDRDMTKGWYRLQGAAGTRLPTSPAPNGTPRSNSMYCGTHAPAYMTRGEHPSPEEGIVSRGVCFEWDGNECWKSQSLKVAACYGDDDDVYYIYELSPPPNCQLAFCGLDGIGDSSDTVELRGGNTPNQGNVYVLNSLNEFGPVCDDDWGDDEAFIVCRQLGYSGGSNTSGSHFGSVSSTFAMDDVHCNGEESQIQDCRYSTSDNCGGSEGAGVICFV